MVAEAASDTSAPVCVLPTTIPGSAIETGLPLVPMPAALAPVIDLEKHHVGPEAHLGDLNGSACTDRSAVFLQFFIRPGPVELAGGIEVHPVFASRKRDFGDGDLALQAADDVDASLLALSFLGGKVGSRKQEDSGDGQ